MTPKPRRNAAATHGSLPRVPFDFTTAIRRLCLDITQRMPEFRHIRMEQMAVAFAQARRRVNHGLQAKLTPLRFEQGRLTTRRYGRDWTVQRLFQGDREMLYILTFYLPRFLDHTFQEKMITVLHELYHVSPAFDGDIRRLEGHYHVHSHSQAEYDREMDRFAKKYLAMDPPPELFSFLRYNFRQLHDHFGGVVGVRVPIPKLIPLAKSA